MSTPHTVERFLDILGVIDAGGFEFAIIGGCAVGVYARLAGEASFSEDLDIYVPGEILDELLDYIEAAGGTIVKRPQPRTTPVAVIDWNGHEVNVLTASAGLPPPLHVVRCVREIELQAFGVVLPLADPFDLLANKLEIRRDKDLPHIEILRRFVEAEVVACMATSGSARERLAPARRLLNVLGSKTLPRDLAERLLPLADEPAIRRFLVDSLPSAQQVHQVIQSAPPSEHALLEAIRSRRQFD